MTAVVIQVRLDSTRLPRKALLDLGGKPVIARVMETMRRVPADTYVLACDYDSESALAPVAREEGFECVAGPKDDVLERFCLVARKTGAETILRATGDNPFLFADAAARSLERFAELSRGPVPADYFTFSGLPHGSGIEVFSARKLVEAASLTGSPYDREHVGPALYDHPDRFVAVRETAPEPWYHPDARTTIDTADDYARARKMIDLFSERGIALPAPSERILEVWRYVAHPVLLVAASRPGQGTGHARRVESLAAALSAEYDCVVRDSSSLVSSFPPSAALVVLDGFRTSVADMDRLRAIGPVVALDEGGPARPRADYLLDIIPGFLSRQTEPNRYDPTLIPLPSNRRGAPQGDAQRTSRRASQRASQSDEQSSAQAATPKTALVAAGGENAAGLALPAAKTLAAAGYDVTVIDPSASGTSKESELLTVSGPIDNLRERLYLYDVVVTHYGFTAFEALAAGCSVVLFSPTAYHRRLALASGFSALPLGKPGLSRLPAMIASGLRSPDVVTPSTRSSDLSASIRHLASGERSPCPLCGAADVPRFVARYADRTVARCLSCGMLFLSFRVESRKPYTRSYFFDEYRAQYGKTYLEDFESIKARGLVRMKLIDALHSREFGDSPDANKNVLDVGCAYGPFLSAARDLGWNPFGTDISEDGVAYVRDELGIPAWRAAFPAPDAGNRIGSRSYGALTFWYVIEHFRDLTAVLARARKLLVSGGVLAFSTPTETGVSGVFSRRDFLARSPIDHYTVWNHRSVRRQLARYGFTVRKIESTGHHVERFPLMRRLDSASKSGGRVRSALARALMMPCGAACSLASKAFRLGDTFEVYAIKNGTLEDAR